MSVIFIILIFISFCCLVVYLVRKEEKKEALPTMKYAMDNAVDSFKILTTTFSNLKPAVEGLDKTFQSFVKNRYFKDPSREMVNIKSKEELL